MKSLLLKIRFLYLGIKEINKLNIGDEVLIDNTKYILSSYKYTDTNNLQDHWSMTNMTNGDYEIHGTENIRKLKTKRNIKLAIVSTYRFYMNYWYEIMRKDISFRNIFRVTYQNYFKIQKGID